MRRIFSNRNFTLIFTGNLVSSIGTTFYNFAISWFILDLTNSAFQAGLYMAVGAVVTLLLTPIAGVIADRFNKVRIVYITDYVRGIAIITAGLVIFSGISDNLTLIVLYACTIILGINGALFSPAVTSLQTEIVDPEDLQSANATMSMIGSFQGIIGLALGGILYVIVGINWIFIINGLTFIFSGVSEMFIRHQFVKKEETLTLERGVDDFKSGLKYLFSIRGLMPLMMGSLMLNFAFVPMGNNAFPYMFNQVLKTTPLHYSFVGMSISIGTLLGAIIIGNLQGRISVKKSTIYGIFSILVIFMSITAMFALIINGSIAYTLFLVAVLLLMGALGVTLMYTNIPMQTAFARNIEPEYRGRAFSVTQTLSMAATPLAVFLGGVVIEFSGLMVLLYSCIAIQVFIILFVFSNKNIRYFFNNFK